MLCNEKYESSKSPVKVIEWEEIICGVGMRCSEILWGVIRSGFLRVGGNEAKSVYL